MTYGVTVWVPYLLCWVTHLSDFASWIRWEGEREGWKWDFIEHSVSVENPGLAHFVRAETSTWPNPIKRFEGWQVQSVSRWLFLTSWIQFRRWASSLGLSQTEKWNIAGENVVDGEQAKIDKTTFLFLSCYLHRILLYSIIKTAAFHHSYKTFYSYSK